MLDITPGGPPIFAVQIRKRSADLPPRPRKMTDEQKVVYGQATIHMTLWVSLEPDIAIMATDQFVPGPDYRPSHHYWDGLKTAFLAAPVVAQKPYTSTKSAESALERLVANLNEWSERGTSTADMLAVVGRWAAGKKITPPPHPERDAILAEAKAAEDRRAEEAAERLASLPVGPTFRIDRVFVPKERRAQRPEFVSQEEWNAHRMAITMLYAWIEDEGDTVYLSEGPIPGVFRVNRGQAEYVHPATTDYTQTRDAIGSVSVLASKSYANHRSARDAMDRVVSQLQEHADKGADQAAIRALVVEWGQGGRIGLAPTQITHVLKASVSRPQAAVDNSNDLDQYEAPMDPPEVDYTPWIIGGVVVVGVLVFVISMVQ